MAVGKDDGIDWCNVALRSPVPSDVDEIWLTPNTASGLVFLAPEADEMDRRPNRLC
jgi:hypothetical protein